MTNAKEFITRVMTQVVNTRPDIDAQTFWDNHKGLMSEAIQYYGDNVAEVAGHMIEVAGY